MIPRIYILIAIVFYSVALYVIHVLIDNAGADVGTAAQVVYRLKKEPFFVFSINQDGVNRAVEKNTPESDELLRNDTYVCGPKFVVYMISATIFYLMGLAYAGADPLSALFIVNLLCFLGSSALIYQILSRCGDFSIPSFLFLSPALFLSLPSIYYLVYYPTYLWMLTFLLMASIYLVMHAYENGSYSVARLLLSGVILGFTLGTGSQAPVCIFGGVTFTGLLAFSKRFFLKSLLLQGMGVLAAVTLSELAFQVNGASFIKWTLLHIHENIYDNHLKAPFPFIPLVYFRILYALLPLTLTAFIGGLCMSKLWWKNISSGGRSMVLSLLIVLLSLSLLPNTPLFRVLFPFFIIMQASIFLMVLNIRTMVAKYVMIALLLSETFLNLPSALFIQLGHSDYKSPLMQFEDERAMVRYFNYKSEYGNNRESLPSFEK